MTGRHYTIDNTRMVSVTTVIGSTLPNPGIDAWKLRVGEDEAERISREATDWGTAVHALVEFVNRGKRADLTPEHAVLVAPYTAWLDANVETVIGAEKLLVSRQHGYAGTTDAIVVMRGDDRPSIVDFKTSKTGLGEPEWRLQLAAYCIAAEEHLGLVCHRRIIVRLSRQQPEILQPYELPVEHLDTDKAVFLSLLAVWKWSQDHAGNGRKPSAKSIGRITFRSRTS